ncbi:hypothetical protein C8R45DRAFT_174043 [Mycena sanguinolenta]|nr:hypothetical protein C8R45DRAFT_174043 [Mycena sanguinolenta]
MHLLPLNCISARLDLGPSSSSASRHRHTDFPIALRVPSLGEGANELLRRVTPQLSASCTLDAPRRRGASAPSPVSPASQASNSPPPPRRPLSTAGFTSFILLVLYVLRLLPDGAKQNGGRWRWPGEFAHEQWPWCARRAWGWDGMAKKRDGWMSYPRARVSVLDSSIRVRMGRCVGGACTTCLSAARRAVRPAPCDIRFRLWRSWRGPCGFPSGSGE